MTDPIDQFRAAIQSAGLTPPTIIEAGKFHRFPGEGKHGSNTAGWCKLFDDGRGGTFGDYSTGLSQAWQAVHDKQYTKTETEAFQRQVVEAKAKAEAERATEQAAASERATLIWAEAVPTQSHDYLTRKGIADHGTRLHKESLVLPIRDKSGTLQSLQFINTDGSKKYLTGGKVQGGYFSIGKPDGVLCIAEGFATGASIHEATGCAVAVAFDCGNLLAVAKAMRDKFPDLRLVLCADDDYRTEGNPGKSKATEAAQAIGGLLAFPAFGAGRPEGATDFNDLHQLQGPEAVRECIEAAMREPMVDLIVAGDIQALLEANGTAGDAPANPKNDDEVIAWLAAMKPMEYDRVRKDQAKALGVQVKTLDDLVKDARNDESEADRLPFPEVEPHPEPIDPAQLLNDLSEIVRRFIVLEPEQADAAALWVAFTWFVDVVEVAPLAIINAPEKACGKSQLLDLIGRMAARPLPASNSTAAGLFRAVELWKPTVLIDEADTFIRENDELKGLINAGHTRSSAFVLRVVGDNHEPKLFKVWGAKALAGIALEKHLPDATMSRAIVFELRRKLPHESVTRLRHAGADLFEGIASKLARFADDYSQQVRLARPDLPDELGDRPQDNWEPLLAIASCAGAEWVRRATVAALKLSGPGEKSVSTGNELLADIQEIFESKHVLKISTADLIAALVADDEKSWATYNRGKPVSARQIASRLAGYGIKSKTIRLNSYETAKGFEVSQFDDAFARYLSDPLNLPSQGNKSLGSNNGAVLDVTHTKNVTVTQNAKETLKPAPMLDCYGVTDKTGGAGNHAPEPSRMRI